MCGNVSVNFFSHLQSVQIRFVDGLTHIEELGHDLSQSFRWSIFKLNLISLHNDDKERD